MTNLDKQAIRKIQQGISALDHACSCLPINSPERKELIGIRQRLEFLNDHIQKDGVNHDSN